jgi:hypothetical protein
MMTITKNAARLRELLHYDADSGAFRWRRPHHCAGKIAGAPDGRGYRRISVDGRRYKAHRLAWLYVYGEWPDGGLDHVNGNRFDNRIANLRPATNRQNQGNQAARRPGHLKGAHKISKGHGWQARLAGKYLGSFQTEEEAHRAYMLAAENYYGEFARAK